MKKAQEFAASRLKGTQLGFRIPPSIRQQPAVLYGIEKDFGYGDSSQRRSFVQIADDFATEYAKVVDVFADGFSRKLKLDQVMDKGTKAIDEFLAGREIFRESHPTLGPFMEILAASQLIQRNNSLRLARGVSYGRSFLLAPLNLHEIDHDSKPVSPSFGIRL